MEFSLDQVVSVIKVGDHSLKDDIDAFSQSHNFNEDQVKEFKEKVLIDIIDRNRITTEMYEDIYKLIPDGTVFEYPVSGLAENPDPNLPPERKIIRTSYIKNDNVKLNTKIRSAQAIIADVLNEAISSEVIEEGTAEGANSDYRFYEEYNTIEPGFVILSSVTPNRGIGFFEKLFPDDEHLKYDFNTDDDNMFCIFSALFKQDNKLFEKCGRQFATNNKGYSMTDEEFYVDLINKCGFHVESTFFISSDRVKKIYKTLAETFNLNLSIRYYYFNVDKPRVAPNVNNLPHVTLKFGNPTKDDVYVVAKLGNHMFNINNTTKRSDALRYLNRMCKQYHTLKDRKTSDYKSFCRNHAKQIHKHHSDLLLNPEQLLIDQDPDDLYIAPEEPKEEVSDLGTESKKVKYVPFVFDFETVLNDKNEHCIYSYVIKKVGDNNVGFYYNRFPFDVKTKDEVLKKLFQYVIDNSEEDERAILLAHNGANFDNLLVLEMACNSTSMHSFREISTGPGNNIMLSLDITYKYKAKRTDRKETSKIISFRDSYKLLDCKASKIPDNYGIKTFKMPYSYKYYNKMFSIPIGSQTKTNYYRKIKTLITTEKDMMFYDEEFVPEYNKIISGELLKDPSMSDEMKLDILNYINELKEKKVYYLPQEYCYLYNKYDVVVVEQGLLKMEEYIRGIGSPETIIELIEKNNGPAHLIELVKSNNMCIPAAANLDIFKYRSLASLVFNLCKDDGVFDNIYKLAGNLKTFIQLSVVGGKVMKNPNEKDNLYQSKHYDYFMSLAGKDVNDEDNQELLKRAIEDSIIDNDAVSLYPSAISLCNMPAGKPTIKNITDPIKQVETAAKIDYLQGLCKEGKRRIFYCLDLETRKDLQFPILSIKDSEGIRRFKNGKFEKIVIGDVALADVIKYQDAVVTRIYTIVLFGSTCDKFAKFIKTLFTLRVVFKSIKLPCQNAIKLLMVSSYGRTILKQNLYKKMFKRVATESERQAFLKYISRNYNLIKPEIYKLGAFIKIQKHDLKARPEGYPHVGSHILEMSKCLMNSMFDKLYSNGFIVYYTDTDSIHVKANSLEKIGDMLGEKMTQFHSDFGEEGYYEVRDAKLGNANPGIFAIKSVFVMKKCYYDKLFCINAKTKKYEIIEHKRVKGIASEFMTEERYEKLLLDKAAFQCNICDYRDMVLRKTKAGKLVSLENFNRFIRMTD